MRVFPSRLRSRLRLPGWFTHPATVEERNARDVLVDGVGVGIASGIGTFLSVFMVRLGASDFQVGLITAMPALTGMLFALPIGRFLERQRNIVPWYSRARFYVLSSYVLTGLVPFAVDTTIGTLVANLLLLVLMVVLAMVSGNWNVLVDNWWLVLFMAGLAGLQGWIARNSWRSIERKLASRDQNFWEKFLSDIALRGIHKIGESVHEK